MLTAVMLLLAFACGVLAGVALALDAAAADPGP